MYAIGSGPMPATSHYTNFEAMSTTSEQAFGATHKAEPVRDVETVWG